MNRRRASIKMFTVSVENLLESMLIMFFSSNNRAILLFWL